MYLEGKLSSLLFPWLLLFAFSCIVYFFAEIQRFLQVLFSSSCPYNAHSIQLTATQGVLFYEPIWGDASFSWWAPLLVISKLQVFVLQPSLSHCHFINGNKSSLCCLLKCCCLTLSFPLGSITIVHDHPYKTVHIFQMKVKWKNYLLIMNPSNTTVFFIFWILYTYFSPVVTFSIKLNFSPPIQQTLIEQELLSCVLRQVWIQRCQSYFPFWSNSYTFPQIKLQY